MFHLCSRLWYRHIRLKWFEGDPPLGIWAIPLAMRQVLGGKKQIGLLPLQAFIVLYSSLCQILL
jgi:hypothetical protein